MIEGAHSAQRSRAESCTIVSPIEMRGSQLIGAQPRHVASASLIST